MVRLRLSLLSGDPSKPRSVCRDCRPVIRSFMRFAPTRPAKVNIIRRSTSVKGADKHGTCVARQKSGNSLMLRVVLPEIPCHFLKATSGSPPRSEYQLEGGSWRRPDCIALLTIQSKASGKRNARLGDILAGVQCQEGTGGRER